jgi:hypothetical protein
MKIGDIVTPSKESIEKKANWGVAGRKYLVVRELTQDSFMLKDLENGSYIDGYVDEFYVC